MPLTASLVDGRARFVRLGGSEAAVEAAARELGGERVGDDAAFWTSVRERTHAFFGRGDITGDSMGDDADDDVATPLWRIAVPDHVAPIDLPGRWLLDWGGAQRWLRSDALADAVFAAARAAGGHATRWRRVSGSGDVEAVDGPLFQPLDGPIARVQSRLRDSFDPGRVLNRGRFHPELDPSTDS